MATIRFFRARHLRQEGKLGAARTEAEAAREWFRKELPPDHDANRTVADFLDRLREEEAKAK